MGDQHGRRGARDARHAVVLGHPVAAEAELLDEPDERGAGRQRRGGRRAGADGGEVENGERHHVRGNVDPPPPLPGDHTPCQVHGPHPPIQVRTVPHRGSPHCAEWARGHNTVMALADALHALLRLSGATYSCVVERDSGRVLAEVGNGEAGSGDSEGVVPYSVPRWGTAVAAMFGTHVGRRAGRRHDHRRRSYHLVRPLGPDASVLVYLRLDRRRSNLAAARRELAAVRLSGGAPAASSGAPAATPARSEATRLQHAPGALSPPARARARRGCPRPSRRRPLRRAVSGARRRSRRHVGGAVTAPRRRRGGAPDASIAASDAGAVPPSSGAAARPEAGSRRQIPLPRRAPGQSAAGRRPDAAAVRRALGSAGLGGRLRGGAGGVRDAHRPRADMGAGSGHAPSSSRRYFAGWLDEEVRCAGCRPPRSTGRRRCCAPGCRRGRRPRGR